MSNLAAQRGRSQRCNPRAKGRGSRGGRRPRCVGGGCELRSKFAARRGKSQSFQRRFRAGLVLELEGGKPPNEDSKPDSPLSNRPNRSSLPFDFMPASSDQPPTSRERRKASIPHPGRGPSMPRKRVSGLFHRRSFQPSRLSPSLDLGVLSIPPPMRDDRSPQIRPSASRRRMVARYGTPLSMPSKRNRVS